MPVYEYCCDACGERFELFVRSFSQKTTPTCPKCGSAEVHKAVSLCGVAGEGGRSQSSAASCGPVST